MGGSSGSTIVLICKIASLCLFIVFITSRFPLVENRSVLKHAGTLRHARLLAAVPDTSKWAQFAPSNITRNSTDTIVDDNDDDLPCKDVRAHIGFPNSCDFVRSILQCRSASVIDYTQFFFCKCAKFPIAGYGILILWLLVLFYTLGNTAADYFCCSLEKLSKLLNCPPTVAGVTLLPLGNGAPDVFASIAAFVGAGVGEVGLNSVLGGSVFVTSVVAGSVSILVAGSQQAKLDKTCFVRDICFFLFTLMALLVILLIGHIHLWGALAFLSIYGIYAIAVAVSEISKRKMHSPQWHQMQTLPFTNVPSILEEEDDSIYSPLLDPKVLPGPMTAGQPTLPQWMWASNVAIYSHQFSGRRGDSPRPLWGWNEEEELQARCSAGCLFVYALEWPLSFPRKLTIPVVEDERWSRTYALATAGLAPIFFAAVLHSQGQTLFYSTAALYILAVVIGTVLALLAFLTTKPERPPRRYLFPWVVGGFVMSIVWFFVVANELVALLITFGTMLEIDPSILGLTVLAWGNSMGDLMANTALARNGGGDGVQIAMSGCYAGPMFNTLIGVGVSLVLGSWAARPLAFLIPHDDSLYFTLVFLVVGLIWALIVLLLSQMRPSKILGIGLLVLYVLFLGFRLAHAVGFTHLQ